MGQQREQNGEKSWLEKKVEALEALYHRFGRDGLKDHALADLRLLLSAKELQLRDAAKSRDLGEDQKQANRRLELEIKDLVTYLKGQLSGLSLSDLRSAPQPERARPNEWKQRRDNDRER
jgi:hypothetical protein